MAKVKDSRNDVFVGCSSEILALPWKPGEVLQESFRDFRIDGAPVEFVLWTGWGKAHGNLSIAESLDLSAKTAEWAILVFSADDLTRPNRDRSAETPAPRDNVIFELGLFYGNLGKGRVFILEQASPGSQLRIPTDIDGIIRYRFSDKASFRREISAIKKVMKDRSGEPVIRWVPAASLAIGYVEAIRPFVDRRRAWRADGKRSSPPRPFTIQVLVPTDSFRNLASRELAHLFEGLGFEEIGPEGPPTGRPTMWQVKGKKDARRYFDIPNTLNTAGLVIDQYLTGSTPRERQRLVASQAQAFAKGLAFEYDEVKVVLASQAEIRKLLRAAAG